MNLSKAFIERPVMTTLLMAALVIFGAYGYTTLPVSDLPNIDFPTISVYATLPGADPDTMASSVAAPLENQFSTINGIDQMTSQSTQGNTQITLQFALDRSLDGAALDVQSAISAATRNLPKALPQPPTFRKVNPADIPIMFVALWSATMKPSQVDEYAETLLARQISTIEGVAQVGVFGSAKYAVRIQADPAALATRQIGIDTLTNAIAAANVNQATGAFNGPTRSTVIHTSGQLNNADEFKNQIIAYRGGAAVRLQDVANVIDGVENPYSRSWFRNRNAIVLAIFRQPGSNTIGVVDAVKQVLPQFEETLPASIKMEIVFDRSQMIRASVNDVQTTLLIAGLLVVGVIFVFLRRVSATIIPSLALPIAVVGTFAGMAAFGYNLDNLSLMALTLSVGFVVDDAIVMLENIVRHIEMGEKPYDAAMKGSAEIGFTILSMTISLAAVFIPIVFMGGIVGRLLHEFAVTIILAILFSGVISVTLTPMLCARILKDEHGQKHNVFYRLSENTFNRVQRKYDETLRWSLSHRKVIMGLFFASLAASAGLMMVMQQDFLPSDDTGRLQANLQAANGTSYDRMAKYTQAVARIVGDDPNVEKVLAQMEGSNGSAGINNARLMMITLKPLRDRPNGGADSVVREMRPKLSHIPGVNVFLLNPPAIRLGARNARSNYQYTLQGLDFAQLVDYSGRLLRQLRQIPGFVDLSSDYDAAMPAAQIKIDRDRAAAFGVSPQQIENALGSAFGGQQISQINTSANQYEVIMEVLPRYQRDMSTLDRLYVTSASGTLVPLKAVTKVEAGTVALSVNHAGQVPAVTISFDLAAGKALSDAVSGIRRASEEVGMPDTIQGNFQGTAAAFQSSTQNMGLLLIIAMVVVYIILGILYESFIHPLTILSGLPSAAVGALLTLYIAHLLFLAGITPSDMSLTLYAFVGMIMLIGIVKKNAIMMIDYALNRQRSANIGPEQAIYEAAITRFRPIMMTTMAAMMGTLPIALGTGAGAESRRPLGLCVAGGLLLSQLLTLYITPVIYTYLDRLAGESRAGKPQRGVAQMPAE
ncbi:MAG TPA: efflux RND transporter permease subunit [Rhizomicrobium sp.]|jgi:HAE1 family hydrophobic/amphiphilic exporter-1|nr:efflux RND transporter permease subunit [Rhizomicrobium sp.]